jgi:hypothetical protein
LSVGRDRLQPGVAVLGIDSVGVASDGAQFLFLTVESAADDPPARSDLRFRFDGQLHSSGRTTGSGQTQVWRASNSDDRYDADRGSGWVLFELPETGDASDAALTWEGGEWRPGDSLRTRLASSPPPLSLEWSVPETPTPGETPIGFTVINEGDRRGRFVAGVNETGIRTAYSPIAAFSRPVPPGETVSWETVHENGLEPDDPAVGDGESDGRYVLSWPGDDREREVRFVSESG